MTPTPDPLSEGEIEALEKLLEKASGLPWFAGPTLSNGLSTIGDGRRHGMYVVKGEMHEIALIIAAVNALPRLIQAARQSSPMGWRPIDDEAKSGDDYDIWIAPVSEDGFKLTPCRVPNAHFHCGEWLVYGQDAEEGWIAVQHPVTHYMPLPVPPQAGEGGGDQDCRAVTAGPDHTPGPWQVSGGRSNYSLYGHNVGPDGYWIAVVPYSDATPEEHCASLADARLIAAAPDLAAFAHALDASWTEAFPEGPDGDASNGIFSMGEEHRALWRQCRAALTKASPGAGPLIRSSSDGSETQSKSRSTGGEI